MSEQIINVDFESEMGQSYVDYAMSVITDRALPDVRDGLKPVQRKILYAINQLTHSNTPHRKCARIVGDTMGKYHPHGDSSIYEGLVNLAQDWKLLHPLIDSHGNFGSIDGDGAAAMRYTEARISEYAEDVCMKDLGYFKDQFVPNFDNTEMEPTILPFQIPNILVSGAKGIAVGMATNIPTHNLGEVIDSFILYMKNEKISLEELLEVMPGPDFATGGIINASKEDMLEIYRTGKGRIRVRGKVEVKDIGYGRKSICVTEIPTTMIGSTADYLDKVAELARNRELPAVVDIADRGDKTGECLCIDVKKGTTDEEIQNMINILYKKTGLEDTFGVNMNCICDGEPVVMGLREIYKEYYQFKKQIYETKYRKLLEKQLEVREVKEGLMEAVDMIDLIIEIIRGSKNRADTKACLMKGDTSNITFHYKGSEADARQLHFTERQADAILTMQLQQLIGLEILNLKKDFEEADKLVKRYSKLLESSSAMKKKMIEDLEDIKKKYAIERHSVIRDCGEVVIRKQQETAMEVGVLLDRFYYIKVIDGSVYDKNIVQIEKDYRFSVKCQSTDRIRIFSDDGNMYTVKIQDIIKNQAKRNTSSKRKDFGGGVIGRLADKGIQIFDFCNMEREANLLYMGCPEQNLSEAILFVDKTGKAKQVAVTAFDTKNKCISACSKDTVFISDVTEEQTELVAKSHDGYYIRVNIADIPMKGKGAAGNKLISLRDGDYLENVWAGKVQDSFYVEEDEIKFSRVKLVKMGAKGVKMRL